MRCKCGSKKKLDIVMGSMTFDIWQCTECGYLVVGKHQNVFWYAPEKN